MNLQSLLLGAIGACLVLLLIGLAYDLSREYRSWLDARGLIKRREP